MRQHHPEFLLLHVQSVPESIHGAVSVRHDATSSFPVNEYNNKTRFGFRSLLGEGGVAPPYFASWLSKHFLNKDKLRRGIQYCDSWRGPVSCL